MPTTTYIVRVSPQEREIWRALLERAKEASSKFVALRSHCTVMLMILVSQQPRSLTCLIVGKQPFMMRASS